MATSPIAIYERDDGLFYIGVEPRRPEKVLGFFDG